MLSAATFVESIMQYGLEYFKVYPGVYRGVVTDNKDPEKRGRVQARVPQAGLSDAPDIWIKPASQGAGVDRGMFWPPEVGDTIFVTFAQGNASRPEAYWGGWFSAPDDKSSVPSEFEYTSDKPQTRGFVTRMGHLFLLSDEAGNERVVLQWHRPDVLDPARLIETQSADRTSGDVASLTFKPDGSIELLDINESSVLLDGDNRKIVIADVNGNTITTEAAGITIEDLRANQIKTNTFSAAIEITDANSNKVTMDASGIVVRDLFGNEVILSATGAAINSTAVTIGTGADSPPVRHIEWKLWAENHSHSTAVGNSGPPIIPPPDNIASTLVKVK